MTGSAGSPTPAEILRRVESSFGFDDDGPLTDTEIMQAILDEEGPEALVEAILDAAGVAAVLAERDALLAPETQAMRDATRKQLRLYARRGKKKLREAHERTAQVAEQRERLRAIVTQLAAIDDEPCDLDHHGYCQSHLVGKPCLIAIAREAIYTNPAEEGE